MNLVAAPSLDYLALAPMLIVFTVATLGVVVEALAPRRHRLPIQLIAASAGAIGALIAVFSARQRVVETASGAVRLTPTVAFWQALILALFLGTLALMSERIQGLSTGFTAQAAVAPGGEALRTAERHGAVISEIVPLAGLSVGGMLLLPAANDLLTLFVALEVLSLPLYVLCGLARYQRVLSQESAMKYLLMGAFSSAIFLLGLSFCYGTVGSLRYSDLARSAAHNGPDGALLLIGLGLLSVGLLFKIGAVPFHSWIPDVYQGAPTAVTALMATATKAAALGGFFEVARLTLPSVGKLVDLLVVIALATMFLGAAASIGQTDVKRLLAYSSITQAGFALVALVALDSHALKAYLLAYGAATIGTFALIARVQSNGREVADLGHWAGLGRRYPLFGAAFVVLMFAAAGLPLTSMFVAKLSVLQGAWQAHHSVLVFGGVVASALAAYAYLKVVARLYVDAPEEPAVTVVSAPLAVRIVVAISIVVTLALGVFPQPVLSFIPGS